MNSFTQYQLEKILENLKKAIPEAEKYSREQSEISLQMAAKAGWLQGSIQSAIIELEVLLEKK
jgi:carbon monoxide dehydrogenase subunit G